jgi:hypothetical protein
MHRSNDSGLPNELGGGNPEDTQALRGAARITVSLTAKAVADLRRTVSRTQLNQSDVVNRAVSMYEFIDSELAEGAELIVRRDGRDHIVKLL